MTENCATTTRSRAMAVTRAVLLMSLTAGCARALIDEKPVRLAAAPPDLQERAEQGLAAQQPDGEVVLAAMGELIASPEASGLFALCDADRETRECLDVEDSLSAYGLGGLLLPLVLEADAVEFAEVFREDDVWQFTSTFDFAVNKIPPLCAEANGRIALSENDTLTLSYDGFYCNWALIGNVITQVDAVIDFIDVENGYFTGEYAIQFNGTGNAFGSGYFRAQLIDGPETIDVAANTAA